MDTSWWIWFLIVLLLLPLLVLEGAYRRIRALRKIHMREIVDVKAAYGTGLAILDPPSALPASNGSPGLPEEKFRELILYIARECESHPFFGATKLNKILFFSDFIAYKATGRSITGAAYMALEYGPVPRKLVPVREDMLLNGDITIEQSGSQTRVVPTRAPDLEYFSAGERKIVDYVIGALEFQDAESVSELSHRFAGYKAAWAETLVTGKWGTIPYEAVHVSNTPPNQSERADVKVLAEEHGWSFE